jgi:hypothetical protein
MKETNDMKELSKSEGPSFILLTIGTSGTMMSGYSRFLTSVEINDWETCTSLKIVQWNMRTNVLLGLLGRRLIIPCFLATCSKLVYMLHYLY